MLTDSNGWPNQRQVHSRDSEGVRRRSVPQSRGARPPARPHTLPAQPGGSGPGRGLVDTPVATTLDPLFRRMGWPSDLSDLQCAIAWVSLKLHDHRGGQLGEFRVHHEADLRLPSRDRLLFSKANRSPNKIYGRDGAAVFAEMHGMSWPSLNREAAEELEIFGLILRSPWIFSDQRRFVLLGRDDNYTQNGRPMVRYRIERRPTGNQRQGQDRFDLICPPGRNEPVEIHIRFAATGVPKVVQLLDYKSYGGVRIPMRRVFLSESGFRQLEMTITRLDTHQNLPRTQFRPQTR